MSGRLILLSCLAAASYAPLAQAVPAKQATRSEVVARQLRARFGSLQARSSQAACSTVIDGTGTCCESTTLYTNTAGVSCCGESVYTGSMWYDLPPHSASSS